MERQRALSVIILTMIVVLSFSLILFPAFATKGSYPGVNGKIVFYATFPPEGKEEIFVMNSDGTGITQLTFNDVVDEDPVWSPSGREIAFSREFGEWDTRILVMNPDGVILRQLTSGWDDDDAAWSPDGTKIAFAREIGGTPEDLYVVNADGSGAATVLYDSDGNDESPSWSPDGRKIVFTSDQNGDYDIWLMDSDGTDAIRLTDDHASDGDPCWSPDGMRIVFYSSRTGLGDIYVMNADGSDETLLYGSSEMEDEPNWSPDGTKIAFATILDSIWVMNADGSNAVDLTPDLPDADDPDYQRLEHAPAVGGVVLPVNTFALPTPLLAVIAVAGCVAAAVVLARRRGR